MDLNSYLLQEDFEEFCRESYERISLACSILGIVNDEDYESFNKDLKSYIYELQKEGSSGQIKSNRGGWHSPNFKLADNNSIQFKFAVELQKYILKTFQTLGWKTENKNISIKNILKKNNVDGSCEVEPKLFNTKEEVSLYEAIQALSPTVTKAITQRRYTDALKALSTARSEVDSFFDKVMVMSNDAAERKNRLALLNQLSILLNCVGDLSELSIATTK